MIVKHKTILEAYSRIPCGSAGTDRPALRPEGRECSWCHHSGPAAQPDQCGRPATWGLCRGSESIENESKLYITIEILNSK